MYTLTKIRTFIGMEGQGINAVICKDGKPVAFVLDDATGGEMRIDFTNPGQNARSYKEHLTTAAPEEAACVAWCKAWYETSPDAAPSREQDAKMRETYPDWKPSYMEDWINTMVDAWSNKKRFDRAAKSKVLFRLNGDDKDSWRTLKGGAYSPAAQAYLDKKYPGKVEEIYGVLGPTKAGG